MTELGTGTALILLTASAVHGIGADTGIHGTGTHGLILHGITATHGTAHGIQAFTTLGSMTRGCTVMEGGTVVSMVLITADGMAHGIRSGLDITTDRIRVISRNTKTSGEAPDIRPVRTEYLQAGLQAVEDLEHLQPHEETLHLPTTGHCPRALQPEAQELSGHPEATGAQRLQHRQGQESEARQSEILRQFRADLLHRFQAAAITADRL